MKTIDIPIGSHVAYDQNEAHNYHSFVEAYVMAHRPKGDKQAYWGKNNNYNTVGIAYTSYWNKDIDGRPVWRFSWVRPGTIHMFWEEHQKIVDNSEAMAAERRRLHNEKKIENTARLSAIPDVILKAFNLKDSQRRDLINNSWQNVSLTLDMIEAVIKVARETDPETMPIRIQAEIESALTLLG